MAFDQWTCRRAVRPSFAVILLSALTGCGLLLTTGAPDEAGAASASTTSTAATTAIGLGVGSGAAVGWQSAECRAQGADQDRIAAAAIPSATGASAAWNVSHDIPPSRTMTVASLSRAIGTPKLPPKEIVFAVDGIGQAAPIRAR